MVVVCCVLGLEGVLFVLELLGDRCGDVYGFRTVMEERRKPTGKMLHYI